jgi:hypothetical protein
MDGWELLYFFTSLVSSLTLAGWDAQDVVKSWIRIEQYFDYFIANL